jgi:dGTPase
VSAVVNDLFRHFAARPADLPAEWRADVERADGDAALARLVADYVAGMTDRYALQEHARLCGGA